MRRAWKENWQLNEGEGANMTKLTDSSHLDEKSSFTIIFLSIPFGNKVANWQVKF